MHFERRYQALFQVVSRRGHRSVVGADRVFPHVLDDGGTPVGGRMPDFDRSTGEAVACAHGSRAHERPPAPLPQVWSNDVRFLSVSFEIPEVVLPIIPMERGKGHAAAPKNKPSRARIVTVADSGLSIRPSSPAYF